MPRRPNARPDRRTELLTDISRLASIAIAGAASETYRTCGNAGCRCHAKGPKHGPHMYVSFRGDAGKTTGYYVPKAAQDDIRAGIQAWQALRELLRELADLNKEGVLARARQAGARSK
jgi:hypothetical protein